MAVVLAAALLLPNQLQAGTRVFAYGGLGDVWSSGLSELCTKFRKAGAQCTAHSHGDGEATLSAVKSALVLKHRVVLVGHSMGGRTAAEVAERVGNIHMIVALDTVWGSPAVPCSVKRVLDLQSAGWAANLRPGQGCVTSYRNLRFQNNKHTSLDDDPQVHRVVIEESVR